MPWAGELERGAEQTIRFEDADDLVLCRYALQHMRIADEIYAMLGSAEEYVDAIRGAKKAGLVKLIGTDQRDNDDFGLLALEVVHCRNAQGLERRW